MKPYTVYFLRVVLMRTIGLVKNFLIISVSSSVIFFGMPNKANSMAISYNFYGEITSVIDTGSLLKDEISNGSIFTGILSYDTSKIWYQQSWESIYEGLIEINLFGKTEIMNLASIMGVGCTWDIFTFAYTGEAKSILFNEISLGVTDLWLFGDTANFEVIELLGKVDNFHPSPVPEPASILLIGIGLVASLAMKRVIKHHNRD